MMRTISFSSIYSILAVNLFLRFASFRCSGITIGLGSWIKSSTRIGTGSGIGWNFTVRGAGRLVVGKYCAIGENVRIITSNHATEYLAINYSLQSKVIGTRLKGNKVGVKIGNDVWIGDGAIILPGVSIGDGAVIGAGAVVTKSVDPFTVAAGNPAKAIRKRFSPDVIDNVGKLAWWNWSIDEMKKNKEMFLQRLD